MVTVANIEFHLLLSLASLVPHDRRPVFPLTREGNYVAVRLAAFDYVFLGKWYTPKIMRYILSVMASDSSRVVRRHVARSACQSLALLVSMGEMKTPKEADSLMIEEDGNGGEKVKETKKSELDLVIKALRKDREVGKNEVLRELLVPIALSPDTDSEVRWCLIKLADLLIRGQEEQPSKVTIHLPPTPVVEAPPPILPVKLSTKPPRAIKAGGPPTPSTRASFTLPPKLKLVPSSAQVDVSATPAPSAATPQAATYKRGGDLPKEKAPGKVAPRAQASGMSAQDLTACKNALKKLQEHKKALLFWQPVDPVRDKAPNYFDIIKSPMDLGTMGAKLKQGQYKNRFEFEADFKLMINNAKTYNMQGASRTTKLLPWIRSSTRIPVTSKSSKAGTPVATPTIKLKLGGGGGASTPNGVAPSPSTSKPVPKPKGRKPKEPKLSEVPPPAPIAAPAPPPPVDEIDDGSADLLAEVIAIEEQSKKDKGHDRRHQSQSSTPGHREKEREKPPAPPPADKGKERQAPKLIIGKRKKEADPEDEILVLATPAKKERSTGPTPGPSTVPPAVPSRAATPRHTESPVPARNGVTIPKPKDRPSKPSPPVSEHKSAPPRISIKGKEKEPSRPATPNGKPKKALAQPTPLNEKKCREILRTLSKIPECHIFAKPVDPILDGCPTYYDEIKNPMDFSTISSKLNDGQYATMEDFAKDVELIFSNCRKFNPPTTYPTQCADIVERAFKKEWAKVTEKKLSSNEKNALRKMLNQIISEPISWVLRLPVDPVVLGCTTRARTRETPASRDSPRSTSPPPPLPLQTAPNSTMSNPIVNRTIQIIGTAAVISVGISGQTTFKCKTFKVNVAFDVKATITPTRDSNKKFIPPARSNVTFPSPFRPPYHPFLVCKHAKGSFTPQQVERMQKILRDRKILGPDALAKN
ncbi:hypothetical protein C8T65DRAFT_699820 [Cerioporus squamosus]|nr:hypothetical protein C8T65DRAFT_699820 [Cerioporus squamosus]